MSLLSSFIRNNLIANLEHELIEMAPDLKDLALQEIKELGNQVIEWAEKKLNLDVDEDEKIGEGDEKR